ncbi:MAG: cytochrome c-type biogenesis protein CcmH [Nitrosomonas sp.]|nr:cytochrome c-type biogenesis protein CcmH [Nitrosomonas sp.]
MIFNFVFINDVLRRIVIIPVCLVIFLLLPVFGWSQETYKEAIPVAENPEVERRMLALTEDLRCLVCQNESIADSRAEFSNDIRRIIREQIKANKTDAEIIDFLVERYGDFVLYNPPMKATTVLLWFGPLIMFLIGFFVLIRYLKGRRVQIEEVNLTDDDQKKITALLNAKEEGMHVSQQKASEELMAQKKTINGNHQKPSEVSTDENKGKKI